MIKAIIEDYSKKLGLYKVNLYSDNDYIASATGEKIEVTNTKRYMVAVNDADGIGLAFFHADIVEDLREVKK